MGGFDGLADFEALERRQREIAALAPPAWTPGPEPVVVAAAFVAFARGEQGPGRAGDRAVVGAATTRDTVELATTVVDGRAPAPYRPGLLAAREGALLEAAVGSLLATGAPVDVVLVDATGRDHPRRTGLAVHLGEVLQLPTVGVTHRPLLAHGHEPADVAGAWSDLVVDGEVVGRWVRTRAGVRPVAVHCAWRTDPDAATEVIRRVTAAARTPEPLRLARMVAREERARRSDW